MSQLLKRHQLPSSQTSEMRAERSSSFVEGGNVETEGISLPLSPDVSLLPWSSPKRDFIPWRVQWLRIHLPGQGTWVLSPGLIPRNTQTSLTGQPVESHTTAAEACML